MIDQQVLVNVNMSVCNLEVIFVLLKMPIAGLSSFHQRYSDIPYLILHRGSLRVSPNVCCLCKPRTCCLCMYVWCIGCVRMDVTIVPVRFCFFESTSCAWIKLPTPPRLGGRRCVYEKDGWLTMLSGLIRRKRKFHLYMSFPSQQAMHVLQSTEEKVQTSQLFNKNKRSHPSSITPCYTWR